MKIELNKIDDAKLTHAMEFVRQGRGAVETLTIDEVNAIVHELVLRREMGLVLHSIICRCSLCKKHQRPGWYTDREVETDGE